MSKNTENHQVEQARQVPQSICFADMRPRRIQLPARPQSFCRATRKDGEASESNSSFDLYSPESLDKYGQECAAAVGVILEPEIARLNAISSLFAEKLKSLGADPMAVLQEAIAKRAAAKTL